MLWQFSIYAEFRMEEMSLGVTAENYGHEMKKLVSGTDGGINS